MTILAFDLGASSGRAVLGRLNGSRIETEEIHRFPNDPVQAGGRLYWDILRLYHEVKQGLLKAKRAGAAPDSLAVDSWAVDFGLLDAGGELLGNPLHYRDRHTDGAMERVGAELTQPFIFGRTGIQFLPFNTIYQLAALSRANSPLLREARHLLMIPDLLRYFLTGERLHEFTNATTTQLYNPLQRGWDGELLDAIGVRPDLFGAVAAPGSPAGELLPSVRGELGLPNVRVIATAEHDTAAAVAAVPAQSSTFAYLSCGTWSLMGTETERPVMTDEALRLNFTNEGGVGGTYRLLKNIMGLWLLQEAKREWDRAGESLGFPELVRLAEDAPPLRAFVDPDDPAFLPPGDMTPRIRAYCERTGQRPPEGPGEVVRCILESLALKYRYVLELTERLAGASFDGLHMVGGGIQNALLCRLTAGAIGRPVWAGPAEGSAIGNLAVQWIAQGEFAGIAEARRAIRDSFPVVAYEPPPGERGRWEDAYGRFRALLGG